VNARVLLIVREEMETTIYPDGRMLMKTKSVTEANRNADRLYGMMEAIHPD